MKWGFSVMTFSEIANSVEPLSLKAAALEAEADELTAKLSSLEVTIAQLDSTVTTLKGEYKEMIGEVEKIRADMTTTQKKVDRSMQVIAHLSSEAVRWRERSEACAAEEKPALVGDCLMAAAFLAYGGAYDEVKRAALKHRWSDVIASHKINFRTHLAVALFLSSFDERGHWQSCGLQRDDLSTENGVIIKRYKRYPLVIDPTGQAVDFIMASMQDRKIVKTSFLDASFVKNFESALRFGHSLLIEDVDAIDPVVQPLLSGNLIKTGGRVLVPVGNQQVDFSPTFSMILVTRDPSCRFAPELSCRVSFVNFTVTPASMENQSLNRIMVSQRPDVEKRRVALMQAQGDLASKLRHLEHSLLVSLSQSSGNVLEDDALLKTLEKIKSESTEIKAATMENEKVFIIIIQFIVLS